MSDKPPFKLNRSRIVLLLFGALALLTVLGTLMGSLSGYQALKDVAKSPAPIASE